MKILWVNGDFLHPTTRGGQIRTLEMLRCMHRSHEIHYAAFQSNDEPEALERASEYCARAYPVRFKPPDKSSWRFRAQLITGLFEPLPLTCARYRSTEMRDLIARLLSQHRFDQVVCDFLVSAVNFPSLKGVVLFQHNVETVIWQRRVEHASNPLARVYLKGQARRMFRFEQQVCRSVAKVIAVSPVDAEQMQEMFGLTGVGHVPTGVNISYFNPGAEHSGEERDLVFVGSMDWAPNADGIQYFVREILPLIRQKRPGTRLSIVGRDPSPEIRELAQRDPAIEVTGTVPDVRPYLWSAKVSIIPLRIGGGTRLKIYEAMAARLPNVSTSIGVEGLAARHPTEIRLADTPAQFAGECLDLLDNTGKRAALSEAAWKLVNQNYSWETVVRRWEELLDDVRY